MTWEYLMTKESLKGQRNKQTLPTRLQMSIKKPMILTLTRKPLKNSKTSTNMLFKTHLKEWVLFEETAILHNSKI